MHDDLDNSLDSSPLDVEHVRSTDTELAHHEASGIETLSGTSRKDRADAAFDARGRTRALVRGKSGLDARRKDDRGPSIDEDASGRSLEGAKTADLEFCGAEAIGSVEDSVEESAAELAAENWRFENLVSKTKHETREAAKRTGWAVAESALAAMEPGEDRDEDVGETARAYASPHKARKNLSRTARRHLNRQDNKLRKATCKLDSHRAKNHTLRAARQERKACKAERKIKRWQKLDKATSLRSIGGLLLKAGLPLLGIFGLLLLMLMGMATCAAFDNADKGSWGDLTANENAVALYLLAKGMDEVHVAAIMGNIEAESGFDSGGVEAGNGIGHGLFQWSFGRWNQLQAYSVEQNRPWHDIRLQMDFFWKEYCNEPAGATFAGYQWSTDVYTGETYDHELFEAESDLAECTRRFCAHFERANADLAHMSRRIESAERYLRIITSAPDGIGGLGQDYADATAKQQALINAAYRTPFAGDNWCAAWVTNAFSTAGYPAPGGNACDMARARWCSSTDRAELKVGMVIAVESSPYGMGRIYGHVGIYLGDGKVMHNASASSANAPNGVTITDLDAWVAEYEYNCKARWGWALGYELD